MRCIHENSCFASSPSHLFSMGIIVSSSVNSLWNITFSSVHIFSFSTTTLSLNPSAWSFVLQWTVYCWWKFRSFGLLLVHKVFFKFSLFLYPYITILISFANAFQMLLGCIISIVHLFSLAFSHMLNYISSFSTPSHHSLSLVSIYGLLHERFQRISCNCPMLSDILFPSSHP